MPYTYSIIDPGRVRIRDVGEIQTSTNDNPFFRLIVEDSKTGATASRLFFGKYSKDGNTIMWDIIEDGYSLIKETEQLSTIQEGTEALSNLFMLVVIDPSEYPDMHKEYSLSKNIIAIRGERIIDAVRASRWS